MTPAAPGSESAPSDGPMAFLDVAPPELGELTRLSSHLRWARLPLPSRLGFINSWIIEDGGRIVIVDTGMWTPEGQASWRELLAGPLAGRPVGRVVATHLHPDHAGLAGWLVEETGAPLSMSRNEYLGARLNAIEARSPPGAHVEAFFRAAGWSADELQTHWTRIQTNYGEHMWQLPQSYGRLRDGDVLRLGDLDWHVVVGMGHSPEHVCLYCPRAGVLISGDQVLPKISSNVSVQPMEPDADPLGDWLSSLRALLARIPDHVLVAPAHGAPFYGLHGRIRSLLADHDRGLHDVLCALKVSQRAVDLHSVLFRRPVQGDHFGLATGECLAHLNYLVHRGQVVKEVDPDGVAWYRAAQP